MLRAVIMGPPGAGKGTISSWISSHFHLPHLSSGDLLRTHISKGTEVGLEAESYTSRGLLVPDHTIVSLILESIVERESEGSRWLLDGFPRTLQQAEALSTHVNLSVVINLDIPHSTIIERVKGRWVHIPSGRVYHEEYNPPRVGCLDDHTGDELVQRSDDHPETVKKRLDQYTSQTKPLLDYYQQQNLLHSFSGTKSDILWPQIRAFLCSKFDKE